LDKKTLPIIVVLVLAVIFYWPILEFLGLVEEPEKSPQLTEQQTDTIVQAQALGSEVQNSSTQPSAIDINNSPPPLPDVVQDSTAVDTLFVNTGKYEVVLTTLGGGPISIRLNDFTYRDGQPIQMMPDSALIAPEARFAGGTFSSSQVHYSCNLGSGTYDATREPLEVVFSYVGAGGALIERTFTFYPDQHHFDMSLNVPEPAKLGFERNYYLFWNSPLGATEPDLEPDYQAMQVAAMMGGSRETLDDFDDDTLHQKVDGDVTWAGVRSRYFAAVLIPKSRAGEGVLAEGRTRNVITDGGSVEERKVIVGLEMPFAAMTPINDDFTIFVGPLDYMMMSEYDVGLEDMLDIGTMPFVGWIIKPFAIGIIWLLPRMYDYVPNYGLVIILFALLVKLVTLPLSLKSFKSMQAMKTL